VLKHYKVTKLSDFDKLKTERLYWRGRNAMDRNDFNRAIDYYTLAIEAFSDPSQRAFYKTEEMLNYKLSWDYANRAFCYCSLRQFDLAIPDLSEAIKLRPDYDVNYRNRAEAYRQLGKTDLQKKDLATANSLPPNKIPDFAIFPISK
jgi:tetratricopeptide (TPR) repeat protein